MGSAGLEAILRGSHAEVKTNICEWSRRFRACARLVFHEIAEGSEKLQMQVLVDDVGTT